MPQVALAEYLDESANNQEVAQEILLVKPMRTGRAVHALVQPLCRALSLEPEERSVCTQEGSSEWVPDPWNHET